MEVERNRIYNLDVFDFLRLLPGQSVHCCVTSPPYWGMRDYETPGQIGMEATFQDFLETMVVLFREIRRVLRADGNVFLNMGDCFAGGKNGRSADDTNALGSDDRVFRDKPFNTAHAQFKPKDLMLQPARLAIALQDDAWYVRGDVIWHKPNGRPESAADRFSRSHEYIYHLTRSPRYYFDKVAVMEQRDAKSIERDRRGVGQGHKYTDGAPGQRRETLHKPRKTDLSRPVAAYRHRRSVWRIATGGSKHQHFAAFPETLPEICLLAGSPPSVCAACGAPHERQVQNVFVPQADVSLERGVKGAPGQKTEYKQNNHDGTPRGLVVPKTTGWEPTCDCQAGTARALILDPFMGSGTSAVVARRLGRDYTGCEINAAYIAQAEERLAQPDQLKLIGW